MSDKKLPGKITIIFLLTLSSIVVIQILPENSISVLAQTTTTHSPPKQRRKVIESTPTYSPSKRRKKVIKSRTSSAGSRGCTKANLRDAKLHLLAPENHVGMTTASHPTFFWEVTATSPVEIRFTLLEPGQVETLVDFKQVVQKSGVVKFQLPPHLPELKQGKLYRWTVALICNPKRHSQNAYAYSWIERVPKSSILTQHLKQRNTDPAVTYAQEGIWYDALAEAYKHSSSSQPFSNLLTQLNQVNKI